jgi:hypothetical protein
VRNPDVNRSKLGSSESTWSRADSLAFVNFDEKPVGIRLKSR